MFNTFEHHSAHAEKSKKLKTKENWFFINCGRLTS